MRAGLTVDAAYANVFVTEVQVFLVRPADSVPLEQANSVGLLNATASTLLWRAPNLSWDITAIAERRTSPGLTTWNLVNTLTANQWLSRTLQVNERLARQDSDQGLGHIGQTDWSLGLLWRPLATFLGSLTYSGQFVDARPRLDVSTGIYVNEPVGFTHSLAALGRADLYEGISALVNATGSLENLYDGTNTWNGTVNATAMFIPNPWVSFTLGWISDLSVRQVPDEPSVGTSSARIDASMTLRPTNSVSAVGTISRIVFGARAFHLRHAPAQLLAPSGRPPALRHLLQDLRHRCAVHNRVLHARTAMERPPGHPDHRQLHAPQHHGAGEPDPLPDPQPGAEHPPLTEELR